MQLKKPPALKPISQNGVILRSPAGEEMGAVYLMGIDAWGANTSEKDYLDACRHSAKYRSGNWSVLVSSDSQPVASIICYALPQQSSVFWVGIGSLATALSERSKGYALTCLLMLMEGYELQHGITDFMLFSDIQTGMYKRAGFRPVKADYGMPQQSTLMVRTRDAGNPETDKELLANARYF